MDYCLRWRVGDLHRRIFRHIAVRPACPLFDHTWVHQSYRYAGLVSCSGLQKRCDEGDAVGNFRYSNCVVQAAIAMMTSLPRGRRRCSRGSQRLVRFNRQLHPNEQKWIGEKEVAYAKKYGLTAEQAHEKLTTQANLQVQNGSPGTWNQRASKFLGQAHGMLPANGDNGPGYMFYATPEQKANQSMYAGYYVNGVGLNLPTAGAIANSVNSDLSNRNLMGGATIAAATGGALIVGAPMGGSGFSQEQYVS